MAVPDPMDEVLELDAEPATDELEVAEPEPDPRELKAMRTFVRVMDDGVKIPFTEQGIGLDALVGFVIPGAGDAITGVGSMALLVTAVRQKVPTVVILRMLMNIFVDVVLGVVPIAGDAIDVFWRSNKRNFELIEKHAGRKEKASALDYLLVGGGLFLALAAIAAPILVLYLFGTTLVEAFGG